MGANANVPIRWLHLADFHVGMDDYAQRTLFREIIEHVRQTITSTGPPDLIFITGDIANKGKTNEYDKFASEFLKPLHTLLGADVKQRTFIVPGNHDVDREKNRFFDRKEISNRSTRFFDPNAEGLGQRQQIIPRFEAYNKSLDIVPLHWLDKEQGSYTYSREIKGVKIGIVGINTAWLCKDDKDRHTLSPGINLLQDALAQLSGCNITIVLGHHPINWFHDEQVQPIRAILGKHSALYLHGHLHRARVSPEDGAGHGFVSVQSGAAFQTREGDLWVNGLLWAEFDQQSSSLRLQPREWSPDNRDWRLGTDLPDIRRLPGSDWWSFYLPRTPKEASGATIFSAPELYPTGWQPLDKDSLDQQRESLNKEHALRFFDGATPDWRIALSPLIPRLKTVSKVVQKLMGYSRPDKPRIILLLGPTGEGKSTSLMQIVDALLHTDGKWRILWRVDSNVHISAEQLLQLPQTDIQWLLVSDAADNIANELFHACKLLKPYQRTNIHFLIASRDTDWKAAGAHRHEWIDFAHIQQETVAGLTENEAHDFIESWTHFGDEALGALAGLEKDLATTKLFKAATDEAETQSGALLGALLKVRYGDNLKEHVKVLMNRLSERTIPGTGTDLLLAFTYIAAMHAGKMTYLSRPVLAEALGCNPEHINPFVLHPLGMEAAVSSDGQFVLTRHLDIARAVLSLLPDVFEEDIEERYVELVEAAQRLRSRGEYVPYLHGWYHGLTEHFLATGNNYLAIRIGEKLFEKDRDKLSLRLHLSRVYRGSQAAKKAANLFRGTGTTERAAFLEWGTAEYFAMNPALSAILMACSLADRTYLAPPDNSQAWRALTGLTRAFGDLYDKYLDAAFMKGRVATARLCLLLRLDDGIRDFLMGDLQKSGDGFAGTEDRNQDILSFKDAIIQAWSFCGPEIMTLDYYITTPGQLVFDNLEKLLTNAKTMAGNK